MLYEVFGPPLAVAATLILFGLSIAQACLYNGLGKDSDGALYGERPAHVLEFLSNGIGAAINFWFCLDSKTIVEAIHIYIYMRMHIGTDTHLKSLSMFCTHTSHSHYMSHSHCD